MKRSRFTEGQVGTGGDGGSAAGRPSQQDGQCVDWHDAGNGAQQQIVGPIAQQFDRPIFDGIALADQASAFGQHHAEHADWTCPGSVPVRCSC